MTANRLDRRVVALWQATAAGSVAVATLIAGGAGFVAGGAWRALPLVVATVGAVLAYRIPRAQYDAWSWDLTDRALVLRHGLWQRRIRSVPYFRIQHIDIEHGPLDRAVGLARLEVHTASVTAVLPGLADDVAPRLRAELIERAGRAAAAVGEGDVDAV
jgi:uncharacterized protein